MNKIAQQSLFGFGVGIAGVIFMASAHAVPIIIGDDSPINDGADISTMDLSNTYGEKLWTDTRAIGPNLYDGRE